MSEPFRVAACQYPIERLTTFEQWQNKTGAWVAEATAGGARVLVFPEYGSCDSLDLVGDRAPAGDLWAHLIAHQALLPRLRQHWADLARQHSALILAGSWFEAEGQSFRNRTWLFSPNGKSAFADKVMLTPEERRYGLDPGKASTVVDTPFGRLGVAICYDAEFPILVRKLVEAGAEVILVPSCTDTVAGYHRVRIGCQARALENQCCIVQAVTVGAAPWSVLLDDNHGAAGVFSPPDVGFPNDGVIASGTLDEPRWVYGDIDVDLLRHSRQLGQVRGREDWARPQHLVPASVEHDLRW